MAKQETALEVESIYRTNKHIVIDWYEGESKFNLDEPDNPLPSFFKAWEALNPLVSTVCHFPPKYSETNMRICGMLIGSKGGADTITLDVRKGLDDAAKEFKFKTPERLLANPTEEGTYTPPLTEAQASLVYTMIEEAKEYIRGNRAQGVLPVLGEVDAEQQQKKKAEEHEAQSKMDLTGAQDPKPKKAKPEPAAAK